MLEKVYRSFLDILIFVLGLASLYVLLQDVTDTWSWLLAATIFTISLNDIFNHRICSHKMFEVNTNSILYKVLVWFCSAEMSSGSTWTVTMVHRIHHKYSDKGPIDNMNWKYHLFSKAFGLPFRSANYQEPPDIADYVKMQYRLHNKILNDPWTKFCDKHQLLIATVNLAALYFLCPTFLFNVFLPGRAIITLIMLTAGTLGHVRALGSYRNFSTKDNSTNNLWLHYLLLGLYDGALHNNHHGRPAAEQPNPRWWEISTSYPILWVFKLFLEKK